MWKGFQAINRRFPENIVHPKWAPAPLLKTRERTFPQLGWPRETDSLCPGCVKEVRRAILEGEMDYRVLVEGNPGEIKARIVERVDSLATTELLDDLAEVPWQRARPA